MEGTKKIKPKWIHQYSWNFEVETTWISLIGWLHKTSTKYIMSKTSGKFLQILWSSHNTWLLMEGHLWKSFCFYLDQKNGGCKWAPSGPPGSTKPPYLLGWRGWFWPRSVASGYLHPKSLCICHAVFHYETKFEIWVALHEFLVIFMTNMSRILFRLMQQAKMIF